MKKLLSVLAVAAIVTGAFAFSNYNKIGTYCLKNFAGTACTIVPNKGEDSNGILFQHFPLGAGKWNGTLAGCTNASPITDCVVNIHLEDN